MIFYCLSVIFGRRHGIWKVSRCDPIIILRLDLMSLLGFLKNDIFFKNESFFGLVEKTYEDAIEN